ncbi:MAG: hydroxymethylglutaryl-CoA lyase, partial [Bacteroidota bacterium]
LYLIRRLTDAGLRRIQVTSFVHPGWVPQMADAEAVMAGLPAAEGVVYSGLALNVRGVERAADAGLHIVDLSIATNEQHSRDNANMTVEEAVRQADDMIELARSKGMEAQLGLQTVFGYEAPGDTPLADIVELAEHFASMGIESLSLADSTGMANPRMIKDRVRAVQNVIGDVPVVLHLHDTRGLGMANVYAALEEGVTRFDTSFGGLGGCPFIPGATGNIATEDTAYMLEAMGIATGVDIAAVGQMSLDFEQQIGGSLPGKIVSLMRQGARLNGPGSTDDA